ncbi:PmoA family protein [Olivibacter sp. SDN3]|uniref:DUF6807 domain-containing protein n=1 Tax=Olivibacter sp. SDN3 TaxID=2764720 RepID=UPI001651982B|nr:PmoA family protein [Olivibacter sp. SDN3]QNL50590.1 PmoA family protein [Olivibacter sp. SDN3]
MKIKWILIGILAMCLNAGAQEKQLTEENGLLRLQDKQGHYLLGYQYEMKYPPAGVDSVFGKSGFIHPLNTIAGKTLTRIQAPDHYHHYGLWNPWTHVEYQGKMYDLWNIGDRKGRVDHVKFNKKKAKGNAVGFSARLHHLIIPEPDREVNILNEDWETRVSPIDDKRYCLDLVSTLKPEEDTVTMKAYRYAGLGFRATNQWNDNNSKTLTSTGKTRADADGSLERWAIVSGMTDGDNAGILFLSHPDNFNHPEPIRIWAPGTNGDGDVFFNFSPSKNKDWVLLPGQRYKLKYRLIVFDGELSADEAEAYWQEYSKK